MNKKLNKKINGVAMAKLLTLLSVFILGFSTLMSQSFKIINIYTDQYPEIKMEFKVTDGNGDEIRSFNTTDFEINENCPNNTPTLITCPPPGQSKVSYIFTLDRSPSMFEEVPGTGMTKGDQVKKAFEEMLKYMPDPKRWEAAVVSFAGMAYVMQTFTNDKDSLIKAVEETYKTSRAQTDFNAGFLYDVNNNPGALRLARNAKYKPVVIFMTDGEHNFQRNVTPSRVNVWEGEIISEANNLVISTGEQIPATIYALTLGFPMPNYLRNIATSTPEGEAIESPLNDQVITRIIVAIINKAGTLGPPAPCEMTWLSCCDGGDLSVICKLNSIKIDTTYTVDENLKPYLEVVPPDYYFSDVKPGIQQTKIVKVTARNNYVQFDDKNPFEIDNSKFGFISPEIYGLKLKKDSTVEIILSYTSSDSNYYKANIHFNSSACNGNDWYSDAGWHFQRDVYAGNSTLGVPKDATVQGVICNHTGKPLEIKDIYTENGDASDFEILSPKPPFSFPSDSCLTVTVRFTPSEEGTRSTTLVTLTNRNTLRSRLWGDGSGYPEIQVSPADEITYPNSNCRERTHDTTITITNIGALALDISSISLSNTTDFEQVSWPAIPLSLAPNASANFVVRFNPKSIGTKNCEMTIESNSKNNPTYNVNFIGVRDSIGFTVSQNSFDFGELCINETAIEELVITNTGTVAITVTAADAGSFTVAPNTWTIPAGGSENVNITFTEANENKYSETIVFQDDFCNYEKSVAVTAKVADPAITSVPISIQSTVGSSATGVITVTNSSARDLTVSQYDIPCDEMEIVSPTLPWNIPAGQSIDVTIRYTPVNDNAINCFITLEGTPCDFLDSIQVNGNPDLATATIQIEKHSGLAGFNVQIPIHLRDMNKVVESGATHIDTRITFDDNLLGYISISNGTVTVNSGYIDISGMALSSMSGDVLAVLTFSVTNSTPNTTPLEISNTISIGGGVSFTEIDGEFTVLPSSATIEIGTAEAKTGETIQIPVKLSGYKNLDPAHKHILTTLTYNYSVLEPIGDTPTGTINNDLREIQLTLPVMPDANGVLTNLQFKVMLGTSERIPLLLTNTKTEAGDVTFTEKNGEFVVTNVCINGDEKRLFDPKGQAQILSISPNPGNGQTKITFETQEEGMHLITVYSNVGVKIAELVHKVLQPGIYEVVFDTGIISSGSYYIIYTTPTKVITQPLGVLK